MNIPLYFYAIKQKLVSKMRYKKMIDNIKFNMGIYKFYFDNYDVASLCILYYFLLFYNPVLPKINYYFVDNLVGNSPVIFGIFSNKNNSKSISLIKLPQDTSLSRG